MSGLRFVAPDLRSVDDAGSETLVAGLWEDVRPLTGLLGLLDWRLAGRLSRLARSGFLAGRLGEVLVLPVRPRLPFDKLLAVGLGPRPAFDEATCRVVLERVKAALDGLQAKGALVELPGRGDHAIEPERAGAVLLDVFAAEPRAILTIVEDADGEQRMAKYTHDRVGSIRTLGASR